MSGEWLPPQPPGGPPPAPPQQQPPPSPEYPPAQQPVPGYPPQQQQQGYPPPQYGYPPQPPNNDAVAGFTCALVGATLLFFTAGLSTLISLVLGVIAIPYSRKGRRNVDEGRTSKHRDLAKAGYVIGIVTVVLSVLATIAWILIFSLVDWDAIDDGTGPRFDDEFDFQRAARVLAAVIRLIG